MATRTKRKQVDPILVQLKSWVDSPNANAFSLISWLLGFKFETGRDQEPWEVLAILLDGKSNVGLRKQLAQHLADLMEWQPDALDLCRSPTWNHRLLHNILGLARVLGPQPVLGPAITAMKARAINNPIFKERWLDISHHSLLAAACARRTVKSDPSPIPDKDQIIRLLCDFSEWCKWRYSEEHNEQAPDVLHDLQIKAFREQCERWTKRWPQCPFHNLFTF